MKQTLSDYSLVFHACLSLGKLGNFWLWSVNLYTGIYIHTHTHTLLTCTHTQLITFTRVLEILNRSFYWGLSCQTQMPNWAEGSVNKKKKCVFVWVREKGVSLSVRVGTEGIRLQPCGDTWLPVAALYQALFANVREREKERLLNTLEDNHSTRLAHWDRPWAYSSLLVWWPGLSGPC